MLSRHSLEEQRAWKLEEAAQEGHRAYQGHLFEEPTFADLAEWYETRCRPKSKRAQTLKSESSYIRHALEWLGMRGIARPNTSDWKEYLDWRMSPECRLAEGKAGRITGKTADSHRAVLAKVYRACQKMPKRGWLLIPNPLDAAFLPPCDAGGRDRARSMAEPYVTMPLLVAAMPDPVAKALVLTLRDHGLRIQEALGIPLPGSHVDRELGGKLLDLNAGTLRIERQRTRDAVQHEPLKTEYSMATVLLSPRVVAALREALRFRQEQALAPTREWMKKQGLCAQNYVFPYFKYHLEHLMELHREVAPTDFRTRVRGVDGGDAWHVYRHTFATEHYRDVQAGKMSRATLHKLLRHKDPKTTDAYIRALMVEVLDDDSVRASWQRQQEAEEQAVRERSGKGLSVVRKNT